MTGQTAQNPPSEPAWRRLVRRRPLLAAAALASAGVLTVSGLSYAAVSHYSGQMRHADVFAGISDRPEDDSGVNILVVGSDDRSALSEDERLALHLGTDDFGRNTDTMLLVHLSTDGSIDVVSLPRDSAVTVPAHVDSEGDQREAAVAKLNSAYGAGGPTLLIETVEDATGVRIDHYAEVDFVGFLDIVDAVGGVEVCVPEAIEDEKSGLDIPAGRSVLASEQALAFVRARAFDPTADLGRMGRQQAFGAAMFSQLASPSMLLNPARFSSVLSTVLASITTDPGLNATRARELSERLRRADPSRVRFQTVPLGGTKTLRDGGAAVLWDEAASTELFSALRQDGSAADTITAAEAALPQVVRHPSDITLVVLNGTGVPGRAKEAASQLTAAGFEVVDTGNGSSVSRTKVEYDPEYDISLETVRAALPNAEVVAVPGLGGTFRITVAPDFTGVSKFTVTGASPTATAPASGGDPVPTAEPKTAADDICS